MADFPSHHASALRLRDLFDACCQRPVEEWDRIFDVLGVGGPEFQELRKSARMLLHAHQDVSSVFLKKSAPEHFKELFDLEDPKDLVSDQVLLELFEQLPGYRFIRRLGLGASGTVVLAEHIELQRLVALKIYQPSVHINDEPRLMAQLQHPQIVKVYSIEVLGRVHAVAMQYIPGVDLAYMCRQIKASQLAKLDGKSVLEVLDGYLIANAETPTLNAFERAQLATRSASFVVLRWFQQLCDALTHSHDLGVLHLDIKPSNILLDANGLCNLADFSVSRPTAAVGVLGGTFEFMAPEQRRAMTGEPVQLDQRADIYGLGKTMLVPLKLASDQTSRQLTYELEAIAADCASEDIENRPENARNLQSRLAASAANAAIRTHASWLASNRFWTLMARYPRAAVISALVIPNVIASILQISYNQIFILPNMTDQQLQLFNNLLVPWNLVCYAFGIWFILGYNRHLFKFLKHRSSSQLGAAPNQCVNAEVRDELVRSPFRALQFISGLWGIACLFFIGNLHFFGGGMTLAAVGHFVFSFALAMAIPLGYCFVIQSVLSALIFYPQALYGLTHPVADMRRHFRHLLSVMELARFWTGAMPLVGALILMWVGEGVIQPETVVGLSQKHLVAIFIFAGLLGFLVAIRLADMFRDFMALRAD